MCCTTKTTTTQTLHMITHHEHETNTNLKVFKTGQIHMSKSIELKFLQKNLQSKLKK